MISRIAQSETIQLLEGFPAVAVLGPGQVGKTTLAEAIGTSFSKEPIYLDLESPSDSAKLNDPESNLGCEDVQATYKFIVYSGKERYPAAHDVTVMPLVDMMNELKNS